jgi:hypothetical protein
MKRARVGAGAKVIDLHVSNSKTGDQSSRSPAFAQARRLDSPAFHRSVERVHALGVRALGELLIEIDVDRQVIDRYARLDPDTLRAFGGDRWPVSIFAVSST